jgi:uncharacterized protein YecE (DUF72 family)
VSGEDDGQLSLFGPDPEPEPDPALVRLAARLPPRLRFGTSSWTFEGWKGLVYQREYGSRQRFVRESLREYARHPLFATVGLDRSFYAPVPEKELAAYARQVPEGFDLCAKVWSELTTPTFPEHPRFGARAGRKNRRFLDPVAFEELVAAPMKEALGWALGPLVLEIPPSSAEPATVGPALERFLDRVPLDLHYAVELRDRRLFTPRHLAMLAERPHASHLLSYHARMPTLGVQLREAQVLSGPTVVCRLLLPQGRRYDELKAAYAPFDRIVRAQPEMRADVLRLVEEALDRSMDVYVLVNNKAEGSSPLTVRALAEAWARRAEAP